MRAYDNMKAQPLFFLQAAFSVLVAVALMAVQEIRAAASNVDYDYRRGNETDYMALLAIKSQLIDHPTINNGVLRSWNHSVHHCLWEGVGCGPKHKRVTELELPARGLRGTISPFIGNLSFLTNIVLSNNSVSGQIPPEIGRLNKLQGLYLNNNSLTGEIPGSISGCINLLNLSLAMNNLQGELPMGLGALSNLKRLWVYSNKLSGPIFKIIYNLTSLELISGRDNNGFTGRVPDSISRMRNLTVLALASNKLSGKIPPSLFNISSLETLDLSANQLHGQIPDDIGYTLPRLQCLSFHKNYLSGPLPTSIQNITSLRAIQLNDNYFTGSLSVNFGHLHNLQSLLLHDNNLQGDIDFIIKTLLNCSNLVQLSLDNNKFTGVLPHAVANLSINLIDLWIGQNQLSGGNIPTGISNLINLVYLDLSQSKLTGPIPPELGNLQRLEQLFLHSNNLTGEIPTSFVNMSHLTTLRLNNNNLEGRIPPTLGSCQSLLYLYLDNNNFKGPLPRELFGGSAKFLELYFSQNQLEGNLPMEISQQFQLEQFFVSQNKLSGEISPGFGSLLDLQVLSMEDNFFSGSIPSTFVSLKSLTTLNLSKNNISGPIPEYFSTLPLIYLNLSYNNFEGEVPTKGVFANARAVFLNGNSRPLCGGILDLHLPRCVQKEKKRRTMSRALKLTFLISAALLGVLVMMSFVWVYTQRQKMRKNNVSSQTPVDEQFFKVSYNMLLKATNEFSARSLLGSGTFGSVYKGILDGHTIAVKVLNLQQRGGSKSFLAECQILRNIRHRNLLRIITACSSIDFQRNDFKALVYEFMPNGSLDRWLHEERNLDLIQRMDIAIDVAYALHYLHHECESSIVHCDLKPNNILLDNDLVAHVADFGLAKVLIEPLHPNQSSSIGVRGTIGYAAPEYGMGAEATLEGDIYSFGVLLLELMTRKRPTNKLFQEDFNLHMYAKTALPDQVLRIVDSKLTEDDHENEEVDSMGPRTPERLEQRDRCIKIVVEIGVACSDQLPHNRMKISEALSELQRARNIIFNSRNRRHLLRGVRA